MKKLTGFLLIACVLTLTGCADKVTTEQAMLMDPVGFWYGLWHGFIVGFASLVSLFTEDTAVYAIYNGKYYDTGFYLGVVGLCVGLRTNARK